MTSTLMRSPRTAPHRSSAVGRDPELRAVQVALEAGRCAILIGEAGIGKTTMLDVLAMRRRGRVERITGAAGGSLPLGPFLPVGGDAWAGRTVTGVAAGLRERLLQRAPSILTVDDAHDLDPASAGLVLELARSGLPVVAAARARRTLPMAIEAMLRDRTAVRIEVGPLPADQVAAMLAEALGGPVGATLAATLHARCGGHPLHLRETAVRLAASGVIARTDGRWRLAAPIPAGGRVDELLVERIAALQPGARAVLETVAVAGGAALGLLVRLHGDAAVEAAEAAGVLRVEQGVAVPGHPLHRDAALHLLPATRRARILRSLVDVSPDADPRRTAWRLDAGDRVPVEDLVSGAERVFQSDPTLCARLADAAAAPGDEATALRLAWLLVNLRRAGEAAEVLRSVRATDPATTAAVAMVRVFGAAMMDDRCEDAIALLDALEPAVADLPVLRAQRAATLWRCGDPAAEPLAEEVATDAAAPPEARASAAQTLAGHHAVRIERAPFDRAVRIAESVLRGDPALLTEGRATLELTRHGRPAAFEHDVRYGREHLPGLILDRLTAGAEAHAAQLGWVWGWVQTLAGRPAEGADLIAESIRRGGHYSSLHHGYSRNRLARALALAGDASGARLAFAEAGSSRAGVFGPDRALAEVAVLAVERDAAAVVRAESAIDDCLRCGGELQAVDAAFALTLLGGARGPAALIRLLRRPQTELQQEQLRFARAVQDGSPGAMAAAGEAMAELEVRWYATEVLRFTSGRHGLGPALAARVGAGLAALGRTTEPLDTFARPVPFAEAVALTGRELEVARLAAAGRADRAIADALGVSVRTVESHLAHVYTKTGLHSRTDLAAAFRR